MRRLLQPSYECFGMHLGRFELVPVPVAPSRLSVSLASRTIFTWVAIATAFCTLVPMWFLCFINLLKLRTLADDVPHWASNGRRCFYALVILSPVVLVLWIASLLARCLREASVICSLVRWSLGASGIAALVSLIVVFACVVGALCLVANAASMAEETVACLSVL